MPTRRARNASRARETQDGPETHHTAVSREKLAAAPPGVTDRISTARRSWLMSRIGGKNTLPELTLRRALHALGVRGWRLHAKELPGRPDLVFRRCRVAVFCDGAFWHGHPSKFSPGRLPLWWERKIAGNRERDRRVDAALHQLGWVVVRVWDIDIRKDVERLARRLRALLLRYDRTSPGPRASRPRAAPTGNGVRQRSRPRLAHQGRVPSGRSRRHR